MIHGIHHVALSAADLDRMVVFYRDAFGFSPMGEVFAWSDAPEFDAAIGVPGSAARTVMLRAGNCYLEIFQYSSPPAREVPPARPNDRGYTHFCVDVTDIEAEYDRLVALGMRFARERPADFGPIKAVYGYDPEGNVIEIQQLDVGHEFGLDQLQTGGSGQ